MHCCSVAAYLGFRIIEELLTEQIIDEIFNGVLIHVEVILSDIFNLEI
jgi:hypothetical protein